MLQDIDGQINLTHLVSAGLDYAAVGPEHAMLNDEGRVNYTYVKDQEAVDAYHLISETEGLLPALETSHAIAYGLKLAKSMKRSEILIINMSGRGDKDVEQLAEWETKNKKG